MKGIGLVLEYYTCPNCGELLKGAFILPVIRAHKQVCKGKKMKTKKKKKK